MIPLTVVGAFSGIGGFELAARNVGFDIIGMIENDPYCNAVLDKNFPAVPRWGDIRSVTKLSLNAVWLARYQTHLPAVDVMAGGFPCQDLSYAGKGRGIKGSRSGLFFELARLVGELQPRIVLLENVPAIVVRGGTAVIGTLAELGYDCQWGLIRASDVGASHRRERWFCVAFRNDVVNALRGRQQAVHTPGYSCNQIGDAQTEQSLSESGQTIAAGSILVNPDRARPVEPEGYSGQRDRATVSENKHGQHLRGAVVRPSELGDANGTGRQGQNLEIVESRDLTRSGEWEVEPGMARDAHVLSGWLDRHHEWVARPNEEQYPWEPPRIAEDVPFQNVRIGALGNAVMPVVVQPILERIYTLLGAIS